MKMAALQLMQQKANKESKTAALCEGLSAESVSDSKPAAAPEASEAATPAFDSPTSSESTLTPEDTADSEAALGHESPTSESQESSAPENEAAPTVTTNGTHEPTIPESQNGGCDSPLEGKEADETIPGLAQAKELAESLAADDGSGIGTSSKQPNLSRGRREHTASRDVHGELLVLLRFPSSLVFCFSYCCL